MDQQFISFLFQIAILVFSVVIHEVSHGAMAYALGDPTAKNEGRLTLNPIPHIDVMGSLVVPTLMFLSTGAILGWAKPVPYNPYNLKNQKWGPAIVGIAGPLSNIIIALIFGLVIRFSNFLPLALPQGFIQIAFFITFLNLLLAIFNLIPIPPLDGSKLFFALLPVSSFRFQTLFEQFGIFLLLIFVLFFSWIIIPVATIFFHLITGL